MPGKQPIVCLSRTGPQLLSYSWIGQICTGERYQGRINRRTNTVGVKSFVEETLPVESVEKYFEHFPVLEIDYTFYSPLLDKDGKPTNNFHVLRNYR